MLYKQHAGDIVSEDTTYCRTELPMLFLRRARQSPLRSLRSWDARGPIFTQTFGCQLALHG